MHDSECALLVLHVRPARIKARPVAVAEALSLLRGLGAVAAPGGPLSERPGLAWIALPRASLPAAIPRLPRLGYTSAVGLLERAESCDPSNPALVRWRKQPYRLVRVYEEDPAALRAESPDQRTFLFESLSGEVRAVQGYRGDSRPLSRRGLPVCDARLLVNLAGAEPGSTLLDPFAGVGGIVCEALASGLCAHSTDVDPRLRHGLARMGALHCVADARALPFADGAFDGIAAEPPYHAEAHESVLSAIPELCRVLRSGGRLAMLAAAWQQGDLASRAAASRLDQALASPINRKGLDSFLFLWQKA